MLRKFVFGFVVIAFSVGVLAAADLNGRITKVDGDKITFEEGKKGEYKDAKIMKGGKKGSEPTALSGGLTNEMFKTIGEKGIGATITTDDKGTVTAITVKGGKKKAN